MIENTCAQFNLIATNLTKLSYAISSRYQLCFIDLFVQSIAPKAHLTYVSRLLQYYINSTTYEKWVVREKKTRF